MRFCQPFAWNSDHFTALHPRWDGYPQEPAPRAFHRFVSSTRGALRIDSKITTKVRTANFESEARQRF
jgi:hypothetical protein